MRTARPVANLIIALAFLGVTMSGCTVLTFGGPAKEPKPEPGAEEKFRQGEELLARGKYKEAREAYGKVKESDPEKYYDPLVQIRMGDSYYEEGSYAEAAVEYKRFIDMRPHNKAAPYVKYQIGMCNFKQINQADLDPRYAEAAVKNFTELLAEYPDNPYVEEANERLRISKDKLADHEYFVGMYYYDRGSYRAAANRLKGITERFPGTNVEPQTLYHLADAYIRLGQYAEAKNTLAVLFQEHPTHEMAVKAKQDLLPQLDAAEKTETPEKPETPEAPQNP